MWVSTLKRNINAQKFINRMLKMKAFYERKAPGNKINMEDLGKKVT